MAQASRVRTEIEGGNECKEKGGWQQRIVAGLTVIIYLHQPCLAALTTTNRFTVSAEISEGTCTVLLAEGENQSATGGENLSVGLRDTAPSALAAGGVGNMQAVTLQVTHCAGRSNASHTATVTVTGNNTAVPGQDYLFRDTSGPVPDPDPGDARLGIVLSTVAPNPDVNGVSPWTPASYLKNGDSVPLINQPAMGNPMIDQNINLYTGLSCGNAMACSSGGALTTGQVKASFTFTFAYQ